MKKPTLLILDTTVVIELHALNRWEQVLAAYQVILTETVVLESRRFAEPNELRDVLIALQPYIDDNRMAVACVSKKACDALKTRLCHELSVAAHAGELEALTLFLTDTTGLAVCSGDAVVPKVLGYLGHGERCFSLETILQKAGQGCKVSDKHGSKKCEEWVKYGQKLSLTNPPK